MTAKDLAGPSEHVSAWIGRFRNCRQTGQPVRYECRSLWPTCPEWVAITLSAMDTPGSAGDLCSFIIEDITDRKRTEEDLRVAKELAEAASRAKDRFLAVLSHELRTPLTPTLIAVSSMLESRPDPALLPDLEMIRRNIELEARLIDDLLDLSRIVRGRLRLDPEVVDVHQIIRRAVEICRDEVLVAGLAVLTELKARHHHVRADHARIMQITWNLIHNAVKFTPPDGRLVIRTTNSPGPSDPAGLPGRRPPSTSSSSSRTPGSASRPRSWGGSSTHSNKARTTCAAARTAWVWAWQSADRSPRPWAADSRRPAPDGARLDVPAGPGDGPRPGRHDHHGAVPHTTRHAADRTARIAVAHPPGRRQCGYPPLPRDCAPPPWPRGRDRRLPRRRPRRGGRAQARFDLILSDVELPDGNGLELMRELAARGNWLGIAMSGFGTEEDLQLSREAGFFDHLTKPIDLNQLDDAIHRATSRVRESAEEDEPFRLRTQGTDSGEFELAQARASLIGCERIDSKS